MRPFSSNESAIGLATLGSLAANSRWNPFFTSKVLSASLGSTAGKRGRSFELTVGSVDQPVARPAKIPRRKSEQDTRLIKRPEFPGVRTRDSSFFARNRGVGRLRGRQGPANIA